jgi:predicted CoA-binding protein
MDDESLRALLLRVRRIAVVGLSPRPDRPSYQVAQYLLRQGYQVVPVRPDGEEILGQKVVHRLEDAGAVDLVDVFRASDAATQVVEEAARLGLPAVWLQEGVTSPRGREVARQAGMAYVEDRCIRKEHARLGIGPVGP